MDCITVMNQVLEDWKKKFDFSSSISHVFSTDREGGLCFGHLPLHMDAKDIQVLSAEFDASTIDFHLNGGISLYLNIAWPEDKPAVIESVTLNLPMPN